MATSSLSYHLLYTNNLYSRHKSDQNSPFSSPISLKPNPRLYSRFRGLSNSNKDHTPGTHSSSSSDQFIVPPLFRFRDAIKVDELGREMLSIAVPAALALAADPITSLVDTAFVGHLELVGSFEGHSLVGLMMLGGLLDFSLISGPYMPVDAVSDPCTIPSGMLPGAVLFYAVFPFPAFPFLAVISSITSGLLPRTPLPSPALPSPALPSPNFVTKCGQSHIGWPRAVRHQPPPLVTMLMNFQANLKSKIDKICSAELAAVGVSITVFNLISKLFNVPLLNITTSFVAEEQALIIEQRKESLQSDQDVLLDVRDLEEHKRILPSVSTSLILAAALGLVEAVALSTGSGFLMNIMGISVDSPIRQPAEEFLTMRALGAPPIVMALAAQGTFRGFKDTRTPLYAVGKLLGVEEDPKKTWMKVIESGAGNLLNLILDPVLIFFLGFGISGAAIATVISEYLIAFILLWKLYGEVSFTSANIDGARLLQYLRSGGLLIGRTLSVLVPMTLATSLAAKGGPVPMAGHQICVEVWLTISLLTDALAIAGQALLAVNYSQGNYEEARQVVYRVLQIGFVMGSVLATILFLGFGLLSKVFTADAEVLKVACSGVWFVAGSQPINAIAFVFDGLYYGVSDFEYAAYSMVVAALISSVFLLVVAPVFGLPGVWTGLFLFMSLRVVRHKKWTMDEGLVRGLAEPRATYVLHICTVSFDHRLFRVYGYLAVH
ncbi:hypothetical protein KSS87_000658 [Heliosperma pusillum]|nr:hypothetical protein KSS87_000658 [Heliosperma pusillum]